MRRHTHGSKMRMRPSSCGFCVVLRTSRLFLCLAGFWAYAKRYFPGRVSYGPFSKIRICEIGLNAPSNIYEKTSDVGLLGGVGEHEPALAWSSERLAAVLLGFRAALEATSWGSRWGVEPFAERLPLITQLGFEPLRRPIGMPYHRGMSTNRVGWSETEIVCECSSSFHGPMDVVRRSRPSDRALLAELWRVFPPQPSKPALPAVRRRGLFCQSRSSSEIHSRAVD